METFTLRIVSVSRKALERMRADVRMRSRKTTKGGGSMRSWRIRVLLVATLTLAVVCMAFAAGQVLAEVPARAAGHGAPSKVRALLERCAPEVSPVTMAALVAQESGGDPYALDDDSTHIVYHPVSYAGAARLAAQLIDAGHSVDLGLAQVNSLWLAPLRLTAAELLEPCENLRAGSLILLRAWRAAGTGTLAKRLSSALAIYHSGEPGSLAGRRYAAETYRHAEVRIVVPAIPGGHLARWTRGTRVGPRPAGRHGAVALLATRAPSPRTSALRPNDQGLTPASLAVTH